MATVLIEQTFKLTSNAPGQLIKVKIGNLDYSSLVAPLNKKFGDPLVTDSTGTAEGIIVIYDTPATNYLSSLGKVRIDFVIDVPATPSTAAYQRVVASGDIAIVAPGQATRTSTTAPTTTVTGIVAPLAQTFVIDQAKYKDGIFISSVEVFFATKSTSNNTPVRIELRETSEGIPNDQIIAGSQATRNAADINVPANPAEGLGGSTKFSFAYPIWLTPGKEFALCVIAPDENYTIYANKTGAEIDTTGALSGLGTIGGARIALATSAKQPGMGKLFKMSTTGSQIEEPSKSICVKFNKAIFETGTKSFVRENLKLPNTFEIDSLNLRINNKIFGEDAFISYEAQTFDVTSGATSYQYIPNFGKTKFTTKRRVRDAGDLKIRFTLTNKNKDISPVLDLATLSVSTQNTLIDNYSENVRGSEIAPGNGIAFSKYISKIVSLAPDFDSTGLEVKLDVNRKNGTDIDVYCRVMSKNDAGIDSSIDKLPWRIMPLYNSSNSSSYSVISAPKRYVGSSETAYISETYRITNTDNILNNGIANLTYSSNVGGQITTFNDFNKFQIKIVYFGDSATTLYPKVKNLIATALV